MIQRRIFALAAVIVAAAAACAGPDTTAPNRLARSGQLSADKDGQVPGGPGAPHIIGTNGGLRGCTPRDPQYGTATIGPSGGELDVGQTRLIVPPGALTETIQISGTSPADSIPTIFFEPHGLQFKKPAGLILDASNCTDVPSVIYLNEIGIDSPPIAAVYSTWWHTIAAPIDHFSGYAVAF